jgi:sodium transport system ATP-binding protein
MISTHLLTKSFYDKQRGDIRAVDGVSLEVRPGEIYGLLGANGAGKTTVMRLLATLIQPSSGSATVGGKDVVREGASVRAQVGFLAASTALYGRLTAREVITYFGELNGLTRAEVKIRLERLATELDMHDFLDRRCAEFSTGMKQKTSIARTLIHDPAVMIFDEPTLGLDILSARAIVRFVQNCRALGKTVIYSTHMMHEAEKICDRIGIIHGGRLLAEGTLAELRQRTGEQEMEEVFIKTISQKGTS